MASTLLNGIVSYWKLDEASGNAIDATGNGNNLINNNVVAYSPAVINNGADGGVTNTNKDLSILSNLGITNGAISISLWVKLNTEITASYYAFIAKDDSATSVTYSILYSYNSGIRELWFLRRNNGVSDASIFNTITLGTTTFNHIVLTYDGTTLLAYVNNVSVGSIVASGTGSSSTPNQTNLLSFSDGSNAHQLFSPAVEDETGIWNRALTSTEVTELYNSGAGFQYPFLSPQTDNAPFFGCAF